ncbi:MAG: 6,7-dimethyl-8-ribityllumazine synthase [Pedosphaera sp.]|nr:6,7-dimethyl-8-ribityllumazine synthase [Pedosphaera sp.]MSU43929.1 6,7-dimethyl-8-ribityllumazine synthase [Pedosphaera sp.]
MLQQPQKNLRRTKATIAIVASEYNAQYVNGMLAHAEATLKNAGAKIKTVRVPGAFEIPVIAAALARRKGIAAVICLGVILRGETTHADHVGRTVSHLLGAIAVETGTPIIHEVLLLENEAQAKARCLATKYNRGAEAANTALTMAALRSALK